VAWYSIWVRVERFCTFWRKLLWPGSYSKDFSPNRKNLKYFWILRKFIFVDDFLKKKYPYKKLRLKPVFRFIFWLPLRTFCLKTSLFHQIHLPKFHFSTISKWTQWRNISITSMQVDFWGVKMGCEISHATEVKCSNTPQKS
jgi:hypothetical protein